MNKIVFALFVPLLLVHAGILLAVPEDERLLNDEERASFMKHSDQFTEYFRQKVRANWNEEGKFHMTFSQRIHQETKFKHRRGVLLHINYGAWYGARSFERPDMPISTGLYTFLFVLENDSWVLQQFFVQSERLEKPGTLTEPKLVLDMADKAQIASMEDDSIGKLVYKTWLEYDKTVRKNKK